jgi:hypothetical protein
MPLYASERAEYLSINSNPEAIDRAGRLLVRDGTGAADQEPDNEPAGRLMG